MCARFQAFLSVPMLGYLMVAYLCLQLLDVTGGNRSVLDDPMSILNQALQMPHLLLILLILHHCLLILNKQLHEYCPLHILSL